MRALPQKTREGFSWPLVDPAPKPIYNITKEAAMKKKKDFWIYIVETVYFLALAILVFFRFKMDQGLVGLIVDIMSSMSIFALAIYVYIIFKRHKEEDGALVLMFLLATVLVMLTFGR